MDVVVPFFGSDDALQELRDRIATIRRRADDTVTIVDNRPSPPPTAPRGEDVLAAPEIQSSYYARNRGVARGSAPWILFLDGDVEVEPDLIERYFEVEAAEGTGLLEGVIDTPPGAGRVARYGMLKQHVGNANVSTEGHEYVQTANVAVRRAAFEAVGGFPETIRSGGDADLSWRIRDAGWGRELREHAVVHHPPRDALKPMLRQYLRYGSGAQWLKERYPTFSPPRPLWFLAGAIVATPPLVLWRRVTGGPDAALERALDTMILVAFESGRFVSNHKGVTRAGKARHALAVLRQPRPRPRA